MNALRMVSDWALSAFIALCLVLGGASAAGALANFALQVIAAAILLWLVLRHDVAGGAGARPLLILACCLAALPLLQLIPLPGALWQALPGRDEVARLDMLFGEDFVRPVSLQPSRTLSVVAGLLPPLAALLLTLAASERSRRRAIGVTIAVAILSALLGTIQILGGPESEAYFYTVTNHNTSVGFFSNSNHLSTLFLIAMVFVTALVSGSADAGRSRGWRIVQMGLIGFFTAAIIANRSLAGILLLVPALLFWGTTRPWFAMRFRALTGRGRAAIALVMGVAYSAAALFAVRSEAVRELMAGLTDPSERLDYLRGTLALATDMFPFGSGFGTFRALYAGQEDLAQVTTVFVNHTHNDYAELLLETGIAGPLLLAAFALWFALRLRAMMRDGRAAPPEAVAAAAAIVLIALHSVVDYPLRTAAIGAVAAMCAGLLVYRREGGKMPASARASR